MILRTTGLWVSSVNLACVIRVESLNSLVISGRFVMRFAERSFHGDEDHGQEKLLLLARGRRRSVPGMSTAFLTVRSDRFLFVTKFNQKRNNVICLKQLCRADQHLTQHTQAQFPIDRSGIRLNSKLFAQTVVRRAVIMWRELVKRANPSYIFQEDEDRTRCNRHAGQPSLAQHALDANTWAGGVSLGYFAHASAKFSEARLSQT